MPDLTAAAGQLVRIAQTASRPVVLIDGGSGSGKSVLGSLLAPLLGARLLQLEDMYPGWDGLERASADLYELVLTSETPSWRDWDWERSEPVSWHQLDPTSPLVVEGSGALSRRNRSAATLGIWIELDAETRKQRAIARDGDRYAPHWDRWAAQETAFGARERPAELADVVLDAASGGLTLRNV